MSTHTSKWFKNLRIKKPFYSSGGIIVKSIWVKTIEKKYGSDIIVGVHRIGSRWCCPKKKVKVGIEIR